MTRRIGRLSGGIVVLALMFGASAGSASADQGVRLELEELRDATTSVRDRKGAARLREPRRGDDEAFVARSPATDPKHRIGSLFLNFGGPGRTMAVDSSRPTGRTFPRAQRALRHRRHGPARRRARASPRSTARSTRRRTASTRALHTPDNLNVAALIRKDRRTSDRCAALNRKILPYVSTANVARDLDVLSGGGRSKLSYLGFS